jgi:hypothetical protein
LPFTLVVAIVVVMRHLPPELTSIGPLAIAQVMNSGFRVFVFLLIGTAVIGSIMWHYSRSRSVLEQWAAENGFEILHADYRNLFRGPFFWTTSRGQTVYYVKVRDSRGTERSGWVRCGGWFFGLMTDKAEVRWEDET